MITFMESYCTRKMFFVVYVFVVLDKSLNMKQHVASVSRSCLYHLRNISKIRHMLTDDAAAKVIHSLVSSRLDYCNSLLYGLPDTSIKPLQRVQNIAARILTKSAKHEHITPILKSLHWLPVRCRILFKLLLFTYRAINQTAPAYICELVQSYNPPRTTRSASKNLLTIPKSRLKTVGDRSFKVAAAQEWNKLPMHIKNSKSLECFKCNLKTFLFKEHYV